MDGFGYSMFLSRALMEDASRRKGWLIRDSLDLGSVQDSKKLQNPNLICFILCCKVILAYQQNGEALTTETGGPLRLVYLSLGWN